MDVTTISTLLDSMRDYALARAKEKFAASAVAIKYSSIDAADGRTKKLIIHKARKELRNL